MPRLSIKLKSPKASTAEPVNYRQIIDTLVVLKYVFKNKPCYRRVMNWNRKYHPAHPIFISFPENEQRTLKSRCCTAHDWTAPLLWRAGRHHGASWRSSNSVNVVLETLNTSQNSDGSSFSTASKTSVVRIVKKFPNALQYIRRLSDVVIDSFGSVASVATIVMSEQQKIIVNQQSFQLYKYILSGQRGTWTLPGLGTVQGKQITAYRYIRLQGRPPGLLDWPVRIMCRQSLVGQTTATSCSRY